jgi:predicted PurR-regulated permease PerM
MGITPVSTSFGRKEQTLLATGQVIDSRNYLDRAVEVSIHVGLVILLATACFLILRPFLLLIAWGIIIAIAIYPGYRRLQLALGGRTIVTTFLVTLVLLAVLIFPVVLLGRTLVDAVQTMAAHITNGSLIIPPPPGNVERWPIVGVPLKNLWALASTNITAAFRSLAPYIKVVVPGLFSASVGIGLTVVQFALSIVLAGVILANARGAEGAAHSLAGRVFREKGSEFEQLAGSTIRSVTIGILGVALVQSILASMGFLVGKLPGAGLWAIIFLVAAVLQVAVLVLIPAVIYMFATASVTKAVIFLIWCLFVALIDNVLKPALLGRGVSVPMIVVFLGAIGGFAAMGIIGLFVGATVLSVGYKLLLAWLGSTAIPNREI